MFKRWGMGLLGALFCFGAAHADPIMPDFSGVPSGWNTDRYQPDSFSNTGTQFGRDNVLGIGISAAQGYGSRPSGQNTTFYNTQGMGYAFSSLQGAGSVLSADLYIPQSWASELNGSRRTDMWGVMASGPGPTDVTDYSILGFTNLGGAGHFQVWDENLNADAGGWVDLSVPVTYDAWTALSIKYTGSEYVYSIDGAPVFTDSDINGSTGFQSLIMQAYNFNGGDPALPSDVVAGESGNYTAYWDNTSAGVPEPASIAMFGAGGIFLLGFWGRIQKRRALAS